MERFKTQMKCLEENGYFMTIDGKKSSDLEPKKTKRTKREREFLKQEIEKAMQ